MRRAYTPEQIAARTHAQWQRIAAVIDAATSPITSTDVSRALGTYRAHASHHLAEMQRAGLLDYALIVTKGSPKAWRLTAKGRRLFAPGAPAPDWSHTLPLAAEARYDARALSQAFGMRAPATSTAARLVTFE